MTRSKVRKLEEMLFDDRCEKFARVAAMDELIKSATAGHTAARNAIHRIAQRMRGLH